MEQMRCTLGTFKAATTTEEMRTSMMGPERTRRREHVRGKACGGWESNEEDQTHEERSRLVEEKEREQLKEALVALELDQADKNAEWIDIKSKWALIDLGQFLPFRTEDSVEETRDAAAAEPEEVGHVRKFCAAEAFPTLEEVSYAFQE